MTENVIETTTVPVTRRRVLVVTGDPIAAKMAGPGIRACELARVLSTTMDVRVASLVGAEPVELSFDVVVAHRSALRPHVEWADVVIVQGFVLSLNPWIAKTNKIIVADLYDPMHFEHLEDVRGRSEPAALRDVDQTVAALTQQMRRADFFICASEKQRDMWLGHLAAVGRINPLTYAADDTLRRLIDVVPFGISDEPFEPGERTGPARAGRALSPAIKGVVPGIGAKDKVILWGGGIYNWFDPLTLIRAVHQLSSRRKTVRLFFLGVAHPNADVTALDMVTRARALADELNLTGTHVFFNETWVDYARRGDYLRDADAGASTHLEHLETAFSFRTRILDYFWAGLPVVATAGDSFADIIASHGAGVVVPENDVDALAHALDRMLFHADGRQAAQASRDLAQRFRWSAVARPLVEFCERGMRAADSAVISRPIPTRYLAPSLLSGKLRGARAVLRERGVGGIARRLLR